MDSNTKVAIVTGGGSGIGLATAMRFGRSGFRVLIADVQENKAHLAADAVRSAGAAEALGAACDVALEADAIRTVNLAISKFGRLDIVVNNAGMMIFKPIEQMNESDLLTVFRVNLFGAFWFTKQAFLNCGSGSAVVNVCSIHAVQTSGLVAAYAAAKSGLLSLTRSASIEGKSKGIRVNAVLPGAIDTPLLHENPNVKSGSEMITAMGQAEDVAAAIEYLASDNAGFITGAALLVDGGRLAQL